MHSLTEKNLKINLCALKVWECCPLETWAVNGSSCFQCFWFNTCSQRISAGSLAFKSFSYVPKGMGVIFTI